MTRFARAKGSKASNERAPEDATPWAVMKEQLQRAKEDADRAKLQEQAEKQRLQNYENFLQERKTAKRKSTWCDFPSEKSTAFQESPVKRSKNKSHSDNASEARNTVETKNNITSKNEAVDTKTPDNLSKKKNKSKKKKENKLNEQTSSHELVAHDQSELEIKKKKNKIQNQGLETSESVPQEATVIQTKLKKNKIKIDLENSEIVSQKAVTNSHSDMIQRNKKKKKINKQDLETSECVSQEAVTNAQSDVNKTKKKKNKKNMKNPDLEPTETSDFPAKINKKGHFKSNDGITDSSHSNLETTESSATKQLKTYDSVGSSNKQKKKDGNKQRRKPEMDRSFQIIINGRAVDLVRFDGFPVMKKDADRLQQLKTDMIKKGIPRREVDRTMKLERRRAEKALARIKRDVCYNCRKGGHNLSDCPDLRSRIPPVGEETLDAEGGVEAADGVCFKCGSTEHRQSECRVQKGQQFRFASCFICKEQGHIARQCPDNPKGLYPNGGACKLCGDVTHLRKDCPTTKTEKEEESVRLETLGTVENIEDLPPPTGAVVSSDTGSRKPKKIVF